MSPPSDGAGTPPTGTDALPPGVALEHIVSTGQSNAVGFGAKPPLSSQQSFGNLMFDRGVMTVRDCDADGCKSYEKPAGFAPLVEGDTYYADAVETMSAGMANEIARLRQGKVDGLRPLLVSVHGRSGNTYWCLRRGGCSFLDGRGYLKPFDEALMQVADAKALADVGRREYAVRAVTAIHGESDHYAGQFPLDGTDGTAGAIVTYADALLEWQRDYETEIRSITRQNAPIPLLVSQMSNWNDKPNSEIPLRQLEAHVRSGGRVVVVGPTYALSYATDCIHFTNRGERHLGEYFAKAYVRVVTESGTWEPLRPQQVKAVSNVVTARFIVSKPPLVLDTELVTDPGSYGFEVVDAAGTPISIASVAITGADTVSITLPAGAVAVGGRLRYAYTARPETCPGREYGPRGNLRDSDDATSNSGYPLFNWAVHFDAPID